MKRLLALLLTLLVPLSATAINEDELLPAEEAFALSASATDAETVRLDWNIADGYYLYGDKFRVESESRGVTLGEPEIPPGKVKQDEFFGEVEIHRGRIAIHIPVARAADATREVTLSVTSQGCADLGVCYPPQRRTVRVTLPQAVSGAISGSGDLFSDRSEPEVLPPDEAFLFSAEVVDGDAIRARWEITPGHYLYRNKFRFELRDADGVALGEVTMPPGKQKEDEFFGRIQIYEAPMEVLLPLIRDNREPTEVTLTVRYQGCAEELGICYPPIDKSHSLTLPAAGAAPAAGGNAGAQSAAPGETLSEQDSLAASLAGGNTLWVLLTFFGLGLLLAFTPCVFPMIPILSSIIVGQGEGLTTRKAFILSLVYVLAMAATYTVAGVIAGLFGANLQAAFQNPWILSTFAAVFVLLSLSMFGFYDLQLPSALQSKLSEISGRQEGGTLTGVAIMGLLSALIVGPCVAPPLMGALIYIGQTGDPWLGGAALFALSMGMGAPLIAIGTAGGKLLPRAGGWMDAVKAVFGVLLLGVAIWLLERILPATLVMVLWGVLALISAVYLGALEPIREGGSGWRKLWKGLGVVLLLYGALLLIGASTGGKDPLQPLGQMRLAGGSATAPAHLEFKRIKSVADLEQELTTAAAQGRPVMLDFYADWCVSCKEMEKYTFSDPDVIEALRGATLLQADVTANDKTDQALLRHFNLIGPPAILFWNGTEQERKNFRVVGFMPAETFAAHTRQALNPEP